MTHFDAGSSIEVMKTTAFIFSAFCFAISLHGIGCAHRAALAPHSVADAATATLNTTDRQSRDLASQMGSRGLVVIALSADCPISRKYSPVVENLRREFSGKGIHFIYINTSEINDPAKVLSYIKEYSVDTPVFFDPAFALARRLKMQRTTEAVLLSPEWSVLYQGAIDDRFDYEINRPVRESFLKKALNEWLDSGRMTQVSQPAKGCALDY